MSGLPEIKMVPGGAEIGGVIVRLPGQGLRLFERLAVRPGAWVSRDDLVRAAYPHPDREPTSAESNVYVQLTKLRRSLSNSGLDIENARATGWRLVPAGNRSTPTDEIESLADLWGVPRWAVARLCDDGRTSARAIIERMDARARCDLIGGGA